MMMSPESFVDYSLKGKTKEEAMKEINDLRAEDERLKKIMREDPFSEEMMTCPSPDLILGVHWSYYEAAKRYFDEQGWEYDSTEDEIADWKFNEKLNDLKSVMLCIGGCFEGQEMRLVVIEDDKIISNYSDRRIHEPGYVPNPDDEPVDLSGISKDEFVSWLKDLHMGLWKSEYFNPCVLDGTEWELELKFSNGDKIRVRGANSYPYGFYSLLETMGMEHCLDEEEVLK